MTKKLPCRLAGAGNFLMLILSQIVYNELDVFYLAGR